MPNGLDILGNQNAKGIFHLNKAPHFSAEDRQRFFSQEGQDPEIKIIGIDPGTLFFTIRTYKVFNQNVAKLIYFILKLL